MNAPRTASIEDLNREFIPDVVDFVVGHLESVELVDNVGIGTLGNPMPWMPTRIADELLRLVRSVPTDE